MTRNLLWLSLLIGIEALSFGALVLFVFSIFTWAGVLSHTF
jgi:hypothetical protein